MEERPESAYGESLFHLFTEQVQEFAIFAMDREGRVVHWNAGATRITGYAEGEVLGHPLHQIFTPEDIAAGAPEREIAAALEIGQAADERWHVRKDGSRFWGLGVVAPMRAPDGSILGLGKILADRTDLKQLQEALSEQARALELADEQKNHFLAALAHELRNPQAVLMNSAQLLRRFGEDNPRVHKLAELIERQVWHSKRLVDDLGDIARISRGSLELDMKHIDLRAVIDDAVEAVQPAMAGHEFNVIVTPHPLPVHGDADRLRQVLVNLLTNAARYTPAGGDIALTADCDEPDIVVRIRDNGTGIAKEDMEHIFELFAQGHAARVGSQGGLGIGLALSRNIVALHGGSIQARSEGIGKGSEFIVRLPAGTGSH